MSEAKLQSKIIAALKKLNFFTCKIIICSRPGFPDILAIYKGKTVYIEVKAPGKKPSPRQQRIHEVMRHFKAPVFTFDNIKDFDKQIKKWIDQN